MSHFHQITDEQPDHVKKLNLENKGCMLVGIREVQITDIPLPILQPDGVLVKVVSTDNDMHAYSSGGVGGRPITEPVIMGHESAGEVIAVGSAVTSHKVGNRVAVEPGLPCRRCINCKEGRSNLCLDYLYCGAPNAKGSIQKYFALPADMAPKFPDNVGWDEAGSIQPLAIGIQIGKRVDLRPHQTLAVMGCGPIGLITAAVAHAYSVKKIIGIDINPTRVEFARKYISPITGKPIFDHVFLNSPLPAVSLKHKYETDPALVKAISDLPSGPGGDVEPTQANGHESTVGDMKWENAIVRAAGWLEESGLAEAGGVDRVVEASGTEDCCLLGVALAKQGGTYLQVGLSHIQTMLFPNVAVTNKELDLKGITRYTSSCFPSAIDLLSRGMVDLKPLISKTFPLDRSQEAFEAVRAGKDIKIIIKNQE
ncbi:xylitol dehydrogenase [Tremella mesenterica]|uniref:Xylitol dehydrogenase n=1 Tax=Tremella mesenterica TaxID=5217 RepID=A0A4Q1BK60_TREME|nr:xylitol dehydrogenase [Tremella mesenterica]